MVGLIITILAVSLGIFLYLSMPKKKQFIIADPALIEKVLQERVTYYKKLSAGEKLRFQKEVAGFLTGITVTGVNTEVTDVDRILVAASGIIPIFAFPNWKYPNLKEVLLYPAMFNEQFDKRSKEEENRIMGMVGSGAMNYTMILSKPSLYEGFSDKSDKENTGIHEFVHLVDKTDGVVDGVPELLLEKNQVTPWLQLMHKYISEIKNDETDINPYGATNEAEFLAVASEYFFERPLLFQQKHPELYTLMEKIFRQDPVTDRSNA